MLRLNLRKKKCHDIDYENEYKSFIEAASNPYDYNFGKRKIKKSMYAFKKIQNKVNFDFINKNF